MDINKINNLVAEHILSWNKVYTQNLCGEDYIWVDRSGSCYSKSGKIFNPCENLDDALLIVKNIYDRDENVSLGYKDFGDHADVYITGKDGFPVITVAESLPLALSLGGLKHFGIKI